MILNKALLLKGLGGLTACSSVGGVYIYWEEIKKSIQGKTSATLLLERAGLSCNNNDSCTLEDGKKLTIKHDETNTREITSLASTGSSGKVKLYSETDYNEELKFVIEGGDISFNGSGGSPTKLEQFETYELKEEDDNTTQGGKKYILLRKKKASEEIKRLLGLPSTCNLPDSSNTPTSCENISTENLKAINFKGKSADGATVASDGTSPTLKISITSGQETTQFPLGYKFTLESDKEITLDSENSKSIKANTNTQFKIKVTPSSGTTPVSLSLEKAWTPQELLKKIQVTGTCTPDPKECSLEGKINVFNANNNSVTGADFGSESQNKKITYLEEQENYNQGIKFTVSEEICLTGGTPSGTTVSKIENDTVSYEIKEDGGKWYLSKKENA